MGRDTIELEDAVSTISQEYLLEFLSEYFIPKNLHPELPGPGDHIVDFPEGKIGRTAATKDDKPKANTYSVVDVATLDTHPIASRVIQMVDAAELSTSSGTPSTVERKDHDAARAEHNARERKSLADMSVDTELAIHIQETQEPPVATKSVSDPDPLAYAKPQSKQDIAYYADNIFSLFCGCRSSKEKGVAGNQDSEKFTPSPPITGSSGSIYQLGRGVPNSFRLDTPEACQDVVDHIAPPGYFSELCHLPNDEFLSQYNINQARQVAMGSQLWLRFEQEAKILKKYVAQVTRCNQRIPTREKHIKDLEAQLEVEINMKKAM
ncbi:hypothetical protein Tco_0439458 [Tanacetum coccineum]